jgi:hypothetical protein
LRPAQAKKSQHDHVVSINANTLAVVTSLASNKNINVATIAAPLQPETQKGKYARASIIEC